uniref:Protein phosphatase 1 regulatory subunit 22 n=1 Tax=Angiostrongylus cantonensis TaxID=6313 RepID=A0A0K0DH46_ANGCA
MRAPRGAPVPLWFSVRNKLPASIKVTRPSLGTVAVISTVILTGAGIFAVTFYPMIENDYYKSAQTEERALLRGTREDHAHGQRVCKINVVEQMSEKSVEPHDEEESGGSPNITHHEYEAVLKNDYSLDHLSDDVEVHLLRTTPIDISEKLTLFAITYTFQSIDLSHTRADHIPDLSRFSSLKELAIRTNLLKCMGPNLRSLVGLIELDLYENQIEAIENLETLDNLRRLDLSFNRIREISGLSTLAKLTRIYLVHNKITEIKGFDSLLELELLELGDNRITNIKNISHLTKLRELYIGKNKITRIEGLESLKDLRLLSIPANRLTKLENLQALTNLEEIYLSDQGIEDISHLALLRKLRIIDISNNEVTSLDGISELKELTDLWANDNRISNWAEIDKLSGLDKLDTVYLERNPIYESDRTAYRRKVMLALQQVKQIDATMCR